MGRHSRGKGVWGRREGGQVKEKGGGGEEEEERTLNVLGGVILHPIPTHAPEVDRLICECMRRMRPICDE